MEDDGCLRAIRRWLRNIGQPMREKIRYLDINFIEIPESAYMNNVGRIHGELSDKATVTCNANDDVDQLWNIGATCRRRDSRSVPIFQIWGEYGLEKRFTYHPSPSLSTVPGRQVELEYSLVFLPGKSWFGPGGPRRWHRHGTKSKNGSDSGGGDESDNKGGDWKREESEQR